MVLARPLWKRKQEDYDLCGVHYQEQFLEDDHYPMLIGKIICFLLRGLGFLCIISNHMGLGLLWTKHENV